ncbi:hypothetical protein SAMN02745866_03050 [Alteromonadaceae bacterium Bs31]|nr:hypothetical protein SAMN02745866_03050 [Alteromonadaceae bacterium Bs31]
MKHYGFKLPPLDGYGAKYIEHRSLGLIAALVLGALFAEPWLILLGLVFYISGSLAEIWGEDIIILSAIIPISCLLWFTSAAIAFERIYPGSIIFAVIATALIVDALSTPPVNDIKEQ